MRPKKIRSTVKVKADKRPRYRVMGDDGTVLYTCSTKTAASAFMRGYQLGLKHRARAMTVNDAPSVPAPPIDQELPW